MKQKPKKNIFTSEASEEEVQTTLVKYIDQFRNPGIVFFAVPNGRRRSPRDGRKLKDEGVRAGVPDLAFVVKGRSHFLEVKKKGGRTSKSQDVMIDRLRLAGATVAVGYGIDECIKHLEDMGVLYRQNHRFQYINTRRKRR